MNVEQHFFALSIFIVFVFFVLGAGVHVTTLMNLTTNERVTKIMRKKSRTHTDEPLCPFFVSVFYS